MKSIPCALICLSLAASAGGQSIEKGGRQNAALKPVVPRLADEATNFNWIVMVPPWRAFQRSTSAPAPGNGGAKMKAMAAPGSGPAYPFISHAEAKDALIALAKGNPGIFGDQPLEFDPKLEIDLPLAGGNAFVLHLSQEAADEIQRTLHYIVARQDRIRLVPADDDADANNDTQNPGGTAQKKGSPQPAAPSPPNGQPLQNMPAPPPNGQPQDITTYWAQNTVFNSAFSHTAAGNRIPVLYVVDSGVQPFTGTTSNLHPQMKDAVNAGKYRFRQGRVPSSVGSWPVNSADPNYGNITPSVWTQGVNTVFTPAPAGPCAGLITGQLDPFKDPIGHGTKIASTAIGYTSSIAAGTGVLSRFTGLSIDVEPIRVYNTANTTAYVNDAIGGIYQAIDDHMARIAAGETAAASVLLFASRTDPGVFNQTLEVTLWWAWYRGMVCVIAGGNENTAASPKAVWWTSTNALPTPLPSSPSRFDGWSSGSNLSLWPQNWNDPHQPSGNPFPSAPYLIIVGGLNCTASTPTADNWSQVAGAYSSRGPSVDMVCPMRSTPCASTSSTGSGYPAGSFVVSATGTSLAAGYVAGASLAYMAMTSSPPGSATAWGAQVRNWMLDTTPNTGPAQDSSALDPSGSAVPKLKLRQPPTGW